MLKKIFLLLVFLIAVNKPSLASENFLVSQKITYEIKPDGKTFVSENISLTNKTSQYYSTEYTAVISSLKIQNVRGFDRLGDLKIKMTTEGRDTEGKTNLHAYFNDKVAGLGKTMNFTLQFETDGFAKKIGRVWEVNLPGVSDTLNGQYSAVLVVPKDFGPLVYSKPKIGTVGQTYTWVLDEKFKNGLYLAFGDYQVFEFNLKYHLKNPKLYPVQTEIALPPDNNFQKINLSSLKPPPENVTVDNDGNWLAKYALPAGDNLEISASGSAKISLAPAAEFQEIDSSLYLKSQKFWESDNPEITALAKNLKTAGKIYDYVVSALEYDYQRAGNNNERYGALKALQNPKNAICMEFTDLFIALSRAAGIPAREINGFAYTTNSKTQPLSLNRDILHAWPEYYDAENKRWLMVDPTWEKTTKGLDYFSQFDFNHFVFVTKGLASDYPLPAGSYKTGEDNSPDVKVVPKDENFSPPVPEKLKISFKLPQKLTSGFQAPGSVEIANINSLAFNLNVLTVLVDGKTYAPKYDTQILPPYAKTSFNLEIQSRNFQEDKVIPVVIKTKSGRVSHDIIVKPFYQNYLFILFTGVFLVISSLLITAGFTGRLPFLRQRR